MRSCDCCGKPMTFRVSKCKECRDAPRDMTDAAILTRLQRRERLARPRLHPATRRLVKEIEAYLRTVDAFRRAGSQPHWR